MVSPSGTEVIGMSAPDSDWGLRPAREHDWL